MRVKIWYEYKHDDASVDEIQIKDFEKFIAALRLDGGYARTDDKGKQTFIPWRRINYIEEV